MAVSGTLITRNYSQFRGVDFTDDEVSLYRSPDSLNMWKDYRQLGKCIETRPDVVLSQHLDNAIWSIFFYKVGMIEHTIIHSGTKLFIDGTEAFTGMKPAKSYSFVYNNMLYIKDGLNYLQYDGQSVTEVSGYIPTTSIARKPEGGGKDYEDVNLLTGLAKNSFLADGTATEYFLDARNIDSNYMPVVHVNGELKTPTTDYTVDYTNGKITFKTTPSKPLTDGQDNVFIQYKKTIVGERDKILKCTLLEVFDNRVFFSGNADYPNVIWHSSLNEPSYCSDTDYYNEGLDLAPVKAMVAGNNALWVMKEPSQANTTIFYHNPIIDNEFGKIYPSNHSSISTGCVSTGVNFNDDICFFSDRGMEAITSDVTTEQVIAHRSSLVDSKLLSENEYKNLFVEEWEGYLMVFVGNKVYLADSRASFTNDTHNEYEWFYWELGFTPTCTRVKNGILYIGASNGDIYTLTGTLNGESYWCTPLDEFKYPQYWKTTNKRGCVLDMTGEEVSLAVKTDNKEFEDIGKYVPAKGYSVARVKRKKWKGIQMKFYSTKPFELYSSTLEAYVGAYVKR